MVPIAPRGAALTLLRPLRPTTVVLVGPDPAWAHRYAAQEAQLRAALGARALAVHHIGSTAVPGLAAKDVVDVCLEVTDPDHDDAWLPDLLAAGWTLTVAEAGHRCLRREDPPTNLHVCAPGSVPLRDWLRFRDRLQCSDSDRELYARTKRDLAARGEWDDVTGYAEAKGPVVRDILTRA